MISQVITGIIGDKFHFVWSKERDFHTKKEENRQERRYQSYNRYEENQQEFIKVQSEDGTLNIYKKFTNYMILHCDFENLTGKFWIKKHQASIITKSWV